jgi:crotonobetainyl-CoA:carnitine CoA-transferase CaiB-like acyl-CoA transferase
VVEVEYPQGERVRMPGNPIKMSASDADSFTPSPALGEHNQKIFGELLGKSGAEIADLERAGAI